MPASVSTPARQPSIACGGRWPRSAEECSAAPSRPPAAPARGGRSGGRGGWPACPAAASAAPADRRPAAQEVVLRAAVRPRAAGAASPGRGRSAPPTWRRRSSGWRFRTTSSGSSSSSSSADDVAAVVAEGVGDHRLRLARVLLQQGEHRVVEGRQPVASKAAARCVLAAKPSRLSRNDMLVPAPWRPSGVDGRSRSSVSRSSAVSVAHPIVGMCYRGIINDFGSQ